MLRPEKCITSQGGPLPAPLIASGYGMAQRRGVAAHDEPPVRTPDNGPTFSRTDNNRSAASPPPPCHRSTTSNGRAACRGSCWQDYDGDWLSVGLDQGCLEPGPGGAAHEGLDAGGLC